MSDYDRLANALLRHGIKATVGDAYKVAQREWFGEGLTAPEVLALDEWNLEAAKVWLSAGVKRS